MKKRVVFTSADYAYLPKVLALVTSFKQYNPSIPFFLFSFDDFSDSHVNLVEMNLIDSVIDVRDHYSLFNSDWLNTFSTVEKYCVQKPFAFNVLKGLGFEEIVYLDPDTFVFDCIDDIFDFLSKHDILITPHITSPIISGDNLWYTELSALKHGAYNLGFLAVNMHKPNSQNFINWWQERCTDYCKTDFPNGLFTDQKWIDLAPGLFNSVKIIRTPGYNVASWNLHSNIPFSKKESVYFCNNSRLKFFHFSGFTNGALKFIIDKDFSGEILLESIYQEYGLLLNSFENKMIRYDGLLHDPSILDSGSKILIYQSKITNFIERIKFYLKFKT